MSLFRRLLAGGLALATAGSAYAVSAIASGVAAPSARAAAPIVIAHRGASAYRPEETLRA